VSNSLSVPRPAQSNLQKLNVSGNRLLTLPPTIALLTALTKLDIKGNEIHELPSEVGELSSVVKIDMSHNMMTKCAPLLYTLIPALCVRWLTTHRVCALVSCQACHGSWGACPSWRSWTSATTRW
jgi:Leucine-rich repeat (LRR) protein